MQQLPKAAYSPDFRDRAVKLHLDENLTITEISSGYPYPKGHLKIGWLRSARGSLVKSAKARSH